MTGLLGGPGEWVLTSDGGGAGLLGRTGLAGLPRGSGEQALTGDGGGVGMLGRAGMGRRAALTGGFGERRLASDGGAGHLAGSGRVHAWCRVVGERRADRAACRAGGGLERAGPGVAGGLELGELAGRTGGAGGQGLTVGRPGGFAALGRRLEGAAAGHVVGRAGEAHRLGGTDPGRGRAAAGRAAGDAPGQLARRKGPRRHRGRPVTSTGLAGIVALPRRGAVLAQQTGTLTPAAQRRPSRQILILAHPLLPRPGQQGKPGPTRTAQHITVIKVSRMAKCPLARFLPLSSRTFLRPH
jgi:hypothetical protein